MDSETIGAFDAKTHFSKILREVAKGRTFHITLRGKPVALIKKEEEHPAPHALASLKHMAKYRGPSTVTEILSMRDEGRER